MTGNAVTQVNVQVADIAIVQRNKSFGGSRLSRGERRAFLRVSRGKITEYIKGAVQKHGHGKGSIIMSVLSVTSEAFEKEVINSDKPVLVDFYADWCGPCRMMSSVIDEISDERSDIKVCKINVDEQRGLAERFSVQSIPTIMVFKNGSVTAVRQAQDPRRAVLEMLDWTLREFSQCSESAPI